MLLPLLLAACAAAAPVELVPQSAPPLGFAGHAAPVLRLEIHDFVHELQGAKDLRLFLEATRGGYMLPERSPARAAAALVLGAAVSHPAALSELAAAGLPKAEALAVTAAAKRVQAESKRDPAVRRALADLGEDLNWVMQGVKAAPGRKPIASLADLEHALEGAPAAAAAVDEAVVRQQRALLEAAILKGDPAELRTAFHNLEQTAGTAGAPLVLADAYDRFLIPGPEPTGATERLNRHLQAVTGTTALLKIRPADSPWAPAVWRELITRLAAHTPSVQRHYARSYEAVAETAAAKPALAGQEPALGGFLLGGLSHAEHGGVEPILGYRALEAFVRNAEELPEGFEGRMRQVLGARAPHPAAARAVAALDERAPAASLALVPVERPASPVLSKPPEVTLADKVKLGVGAGGGWIAMLAGAVTLSPGVALAGAGLFAAAVFRYLRREKAAGARPASAGYDREDMEAVERFLEENRNK